MASWVTTSAFSLSVTTPHTTPPPPTISPPTNHHHPLIFIKSKCKTDYSLPIKTGSEANGGGVGDDDVGFFFLGMIDAAPVGGDAGGKFVANSALLLFYGAATFSSFPFPKNAKHKKAHIFCYAPLPQDLHIVSNWSSTHEVQTWVFHQPEYLEQLENVVKEADMKMTRIRHVGSRLFPNGIGLSRAGMVNLALIDKDFELGQLFYLRRPMLELWLTQCVLRTSKTLALLNLLLTNLSKLKSTRYCYP